jgi:hypothetical protein
MGKPGKHPNDMADPCWPQDPGGGLVPWPLAGAVAEPRGHAHAGDVPRGPPEPEKKNGILSHFLEKNLGMWEIQLIISMLKK